MKQKAYIFDIDGTLADCSHRLHFITPPEGPIHFSWGDMEWAPDWNSFHAACANDTPIMPVIRVARLLYFNNYNIIKLTGRPESCREITAKWLRYNGIADRDLYMREDGDHRPDYQVKREMYEREIKGKYEILGVFEDRQQCVDMWRSLGLTCFQVAKGDY